MTQIAVVGGGILGTALARHLAVNAKSVTLFEKESELASHQTGRNSNVVHAGLYYLPGSEKAVLCRRGRALLKDFCLAHGLPFEERGKVVVARDDVESERLRAILERAQANGVSDASIISAAELQKLEPNVRGIQALYSPSTAITDYAAVTMTLAAEATRCGATIQTGTSVTAASAVGGAAELVANGEVHRFDRIVLCTGLQSDLAARAAGLAAEPRIIPFRGEYYRLAGESSTLVQRLIYPVPDPRYPFLGVHLTPQVDGTLLIGPNAVLALAREGYHWRDVNLRDIGSTLAWPGFYSFARRNWRTGCGEVYRSASKRAFARAAQNYVPQVRVADLVRARSGVRAQSMNRDGSLLDDFVIQHQGRITAVRNAPSPAATSGLAIAERLADHILARD